MARSLYVRVIATFMIVVVVSLSASFLITYNIYKGKVFSQLEEQLIETGREIIQIIQSDRTDDLKHVFAVRSQAALFGSDGTVKVYGQGNPESFASREEVQHVLNGGIHRFNNSRGSLLETRSVGLPFERNGISYALFLKPLYQNAFDRVKGSLLTTVLLALAISSFLYIFATYLLVKPIKKLTGLTSRIAKGHFDEKAPDKRKDEIGELARSFNSMSSELNQLEQMRKEFISNVSHEYQSPLTSIKGFAAALRENDFPREQQIRYLAIIEEESERLSKLSENLLRMAALDSGQVPLKPVRYDLGKQIRKVFLALQPQWLEKELSISLMNLKPIYICADEAQLEQVWHNLLTNSIKYTPDKGEISVGMNVLGQEVVVTFADTGEGISPEDLPHIFDRFYKADKARDRSVKGSGLGLSIIRKIVELHSGSMSIESELHRGTVVTVRLPLSVD